MGDIAWIFEYLKDKKTSFRYVRWGPLSPCRSAYSYVANAAAQADLGRYLLQSHQPPFPGAFFIYFIFIFSEWFPVYIW